ncbi:MAG: 3-deoxy-8-phosphooctulonate synthase [Chlamydiota bacterium]
MKAVTIKDFKVGENQPLAIISGPCAIESEEHSLRAAEQLKNIYSKHPVNYIFKSSYDKANRSSVSSYRGPGLDEGLRILEKVRKEFDLPVITDVHSPAEAQAAADVCDIIQIPAFLCRQTDLVVAAGKTGKPIVIKKGQFLAPWDMKNIADKVESTGNSQIILLDRGVSFGYNTLVSDMRAIPVMQQLGYPVCFDATHSVQQPGSLGNVTGGERQHIPTLARSAIAAGCNCLFMEAHPSPAEAKCDAAAVIDFADLPPLLNQLTKIYDIVQNT